MITAHVFNGNFNKKIISNRYTLARYALLSQQKNVGPGETVAVRCNDQGERHCVVNAENSDFSEARRGEVLYFYHYLKGEHGVTKISTKPHLCGPNYKPATKPLLTT
jgi:hypothetical protein